MDPEHLVFLNRIRSLQPDRAMLEEYFEARHWARLSLEACVLRGMDLATKTGRPFLWLTTTNKGSAEVCEAALHGLGITDEELSRGYLCDPSSKSHLRILAKPGLLLRLTRNFDKARGFVNGALAEVVESLRGNEVFTARLVGTNNMVLVHPMGRRAVSFYLAVTGIRRLSGGLKAPIYSKAVSIWTKRNEPVVGTAMSR